MKRTAFAPHNTLFVEHLCETTVHNMPVQHYHNAYEVFLMLAGKRYLFYDNFCYTLERGDLVVLRPFAIHYAESRGVNEYERYVANFRSEELSVLLNDDEKNRLFDMLHPCVVHLSESETQEMLGYFKKLNEFFGLKGFLSKKVRYSALLQLLWYVLKCTTDEIAMRGTSISPQIAEAIEYINAHYNEITGLDDICAAVNMSKYHFCHSFKSITGATAIEYLNNVRLAKVHSLLLNTNRSIEQIAFDTGLTSAANLSRTFKKIYGVSPREFRKNAAQ